MKASEQTIFQIERMIGKIVQKYPHCAESSTLTDIHLRVSQDTGEMLAFDDNEQEITRCVVEQWIDAKDEDFYDEVALLMQDSLQKMSNTIDDMGLLKPYSFVLEDDDKNHIAELYLSDDNMTIIGGELLRDLDKDLDTFMENLLK